MAGEKGSATKKPTREYELVTLKTNTPTQKQGTVAVPAEPTELPPTATQPTPAIDNKIPEKEPANGVALADPFAERPRPQREESQPIVLSSYQQEQTLSEIIMAPRQFLRSQRGRAAKKAAFDALSDVNNRLLAASVLMLAFAAIWKQRRQRIYRKTVIVRPQGRPGPQAENNSDDSDGTFKSCPFCGLTNPHSLEKCKHCGQYLK